MLCWNCGKELEDPPMGRVGFRETCDHCLAYLHCCMNCKYYKPGLPNDCMVPGTDSISDREKSNLCEEFAQAGKGPEKKADISEIEKRLFGED